MALDMHNHGSSSKKLLSTNPKMWLNYQYTFTSEKLNIA